MTKRLKRGYTDDKVLGKLKASYHLYGHTTAPEGHVVHVVHRGRSTYTVHSESYDWDFNVLLNDLELMKS